MIQQHKSNLLQNQTSAEGIFLLSPNKFAKKNTKGKGACIAAIFQSLVNTVMPPRTGNGVFEVILQTNDELGSYWSMDGQRSWG